MATLSDNPTNRFLTLDALRGIAAIMVMIYHFSRYSTQPLFPHADMAVDFFFALSGFVIMHAYARRLANGLSFGRFALQRVVRLYPFYLIGTAIGVAAFLLLWQQQAVHTTPAQFAQALISAVFVIPNFVGLQRMFSPDLATHVLFPFNNPAWSLFFEFVASFAFGLLLFRTSSLKALLALAAVFLLAIVFLSKGAALGWSMEKITGGLPRVFFSFIVGMATYRVWQLQKVRLTLPPLLPLAFLMLCLAMPALPKSIPFAGPLNTGYYLGFITVVTPLLILLAAQTTPTPRQQPAFVWLGEVSYGLYVTHIPLIYAALALFYPYAGGQPKTSWVFQVSVALLALAVAHVLTFYVDIPLRARLTARLKKSSARPA